jgi:hypothetical protein
LVVWSQQRGDGTWALMAFQHGSVARVPVAGRDAPFDADVGPSASGRPVIVYSRCVVDPSQLPQQLQLAPDWNHSRGCRVYSYDPLATREARVDLHRPPGASDTSPTIWKHSLAFVRRVRLGYPAIMLRDGGHLKAMAGGTVPRCGKRRCRTGVDVATLDLDRYALAILWQATGPNISGIGTGWELRVDALAEARSTLVASGEPSGECGYIQPASPTVVGRDVVFVQFRSPCGGDTASFVQLRPGSTRANEGAAPQFPLTVAQDGAVTYWVRDDLVGASRSHAADDCVSSPHACALMRSTGVMSQPTSFGPVGPI